MMRAEVRFYSQSKSSSTSQKGLLFLEYKHLFCNVIISNVIFYNSRKKILVSLLVKNSHAAVDANTIAEVIDGFGEQTLRKCDDC